MMLEILFDWRKTIIFWLFHLIEYFFYTNRYIKLIIKKQSLLGFYLHTIAWIVASGSPWCLSATVFMTPNNCVCNQFALHETLNFSISSSHSEKNWILCTFMQNKALEIQYSFDLKLDDHLLNYKQKQRNELRFWW